MWLVELFTLVQIYVFYIRVHLYIIDDVMMKVRIFADSDRRRLHVVVII